MRLAILCSRAVSLMNVAKDIAYVAKRRGITPVLLDYAANPYDVERMADAAIVVMTFNPLMSRTWFLISRDLNKMGIPSFVYTTTEGRLPLRHIREWMRREIVWVANSNYTRDKLQEAGIPVTDVVHHGINLDEVALALKYRTMFRRDIESKLGKGVIFGIVASSHPRKGLQRFVQVIKLVRERCKDAKFYIVTTPTATTIFAGVEGVYIDTNFGKRGKAETLGLISAFDFYVQPSLAEGFGLPVLESNALGVPAIHLAYEPLTEFTDPRANIWVPYETVVTNSFGEGIEYELHIYSPQEFACAILDAVDMIRNRRSEYEDRKARAMEKAKEFDIMRLYPRLLDIVSRVDVAIA